MGRHNPVGGFGDDIILSAGSSRRFIVPCYVLWVDICTRMDFRPAVRILASQGVCVVELVDYMSSECISSPGPPTRAGPPASGLDEVLKAHNVMKCFQRPRTRTDLW